MIITSPDLTTINYIPQQTSELTERIFKVVDVDNTEHFVLVCIDKTMTDIDGDGSADQLNAKFNLKFIDIDGLDVLIANETIVKLSEVHSHNISGLSAETIQNDIDNWIAGTSIPLIENLVKKRTAIEVFKNV